MRNASTRKLPIAALLTLVIATGFLSSPASAVELFKEYEHPSEVPVIGHADPAQARSGPPPARPLVHLAAHYLRISREASNVRCHGIPGYLIACRAQLEDHWVVARLTISPLRGDRDNVVRCETLRKLSGPLTAGACWDFTWSFDQWQNPPEEDFLRGLP